MVTTSYFPPNAAGLAAATGHPTRDDPLGVRQAKDHSGHLLTSAEFAAAERKDNDAEQQAKVEGAFARGQMSDATLIERLDASPAPRVTPERIAEVITDKTFITHGLLTICVLTLANGFTVTGESACASPENFNQEIGEKIAFDMAKGKVWMLEGYLLKQALSDLHPAASAIINLWARDVLVATDDRDNIIDGDEWTATIAEICHEANRAWCSYNGDTSQPAWEDAPEWQRSSAMKGVAFVRENPDAGDSASHDSWMAEKVAEGWVYGEVKNANAKTHPCIVPFDQLPAAQQFKDRLFRTICRAAG